MKMAILQRGSPAPEDHHLRPLKTYSLPSRRCWNEMLVASDEATAGSVMQKQERMRPQAAAPASGLAAPGAGARQHFHVARIGGGAVEHLGGHRYAAHDFAQGAYSRLVAPARRSLSGRNKFHSLRLLALGLSCSRMAGGCQRSARDLPVVEFFVGIDILLHETRRAAVEFLDLVGMLELHAQTLSPRSRANAKR